ncbi:hypothetical protein SCHPADRAFT_936091 [Schizopora paradoxa]|uniref:Uncharacterized protein n=1 Tax=Schizopora paradoxa TaxID=27342 RepID=A0A0H2S3L2_9AGAM|nr:hypothetical protein SCHPADRAFT_936091 [Schizopora paradoxa]
MAVEKFMGTTPQRAFVGIIIIQAIAVLAMIGIAFAFVEVDVRTSSDSRYKTIPCYLAMFGLAEIFELAMALDALKARNIVQLVGILAFHLGLVVFAALQVDEAHTALDLSKEAGCNTFAVLCDGSLWRKVEPFFIVNPIIIAVSWIFMLFFVRKLFEEFGWAVFELVGANPLTKTMYQWYQIMICLLKFDFFFFGSVTMQLIILVLASNSVEFGLTVAAIPIVLLLLVGAGIAVQREIKWLMSISLVIMLAAETYFSKQEIDMGLLLYKLVRFYEPSSRGEYISTRATLTFFTIIAFIILFMTFGVGLRCFSDFDKGLTQAKVQTVPEKVIYSSPNSPGVGGDRQSNYLDRRLSIE